MNHEEIPNGRGSNGRSSWLRYPMGAEGLAFLVLIVFGTVGTTLAVTSWLDHRIESRVNYFLGIELTEYEQQMLTEYEQEIWLLRKRVEQLEEEVEDQ